MKNAENENSIAKLYRKSISPLIRIMILLKITPTILTILGFLVGLVSVFYIWRGNFLYGAAFILLSGIIDTFDGTLARTAGKTSDFGALLDSTLDRYIEFVIILGLFGYFANSGDHNTILFQVLSLFALIGSTMVSYVKARGESLSYDCNVGIFQRPLRIIIFVFALLFNKIFDNVFLSTGIHDLLIKLALVVLAVGTNLTAMRRLFAFYTMMKPTENKKGS
jgi:CDP-diacylglycerol---glycerol-3-phosphate 3-phosphatidyltransferase